MVDKEPHVTEYTSPDGKLTSGIYLADDGIVYAWSKGFEDEETARQMFAAFQRMHETIARRFLLCIDISGLEGMTPEARRVWGELAFAADSVIERVAIHGGSFFMKTLVNFYTRIAKVPARVFNSKAEAVSWLKERANDG